jgi:hypothetical protein
MDADTNFIREYGVSDKTFKVDALLVLSELTLAGADAEPNTQQMMSAIRKAIRPASEAEALTDAEALALALRVTMSLKQLGNAGAP